MNTTPLQAIKTRLLISALLFATVITPPAIAVSISDQPIQSASTIKPNIMFILDDSGSMGWTFMPDAVAYKPGVNYSGTLQNLNCYKNFHLNTIYYNPSFKYDPPKDALGASFPAQVFTSAETNGFNTSGANTNLSTSFIPHPTTTTSPDTNPMNGKTQATGEPAYYYMYNNPTGTPPAPTSPVLDTALPMDGGGACKADADYVKVVVSETSCAATYGRTCPNGSADERVNFANWYSYYRTRMLMMKSGVATAFSSIGDKYRVGFSSLWGNDLDNNGPALNFIPILDFDGTQKNAWYSRLYDVRASSGTPLHTALDRAGQYYSGATPFGASPDPVQYSCQKNFTILSTDGFWNSQTTFPGNWDKTVPASMPIKQGKTVYDSADTGLVQGAQFPRPYLEGTTTDSDSLADVAMKYWVKDLRTTGATAPNNVPASTSDPAYWQHMNTLTIGLGVNGTLIYPTALTAITAGTADWPNAVGDSATAIDDLWHAAVNGRGSYYKASDPTTLASGLTGALAAISGASFFGIGPSVSTNNLGIPDVTDFTQYYSSYKIINWSGDIEKFNTDLTTGLKTGAALWSANTRLDLQYPFGSSNWSDRVIVTKKPDGTTINFAYANLDATQQTALCYKATPTGACVAGDTKLVDYLRGDSTYEGDYGVAGKYFRNRKDIAETTFYKRNLFGDIVDSQPVYVAAEDRPYLDTTDVGYSSYQTATLTRAKTVYAGANDGMLHAIDASNGNELWAYIPSFLIRNENDTSVPPRENGLRALSYQENGDPSFAHHFYINGQIEIGAVDFNHTGTDTPPATGDWRTLLVGGLGKGGKGFYAVDVTTQTSNPSGKILWEFPNASTPVTGKMGYSFGKPIIAKTHQWGWVVMLPSGYNNTDGIGYVFVLNAKTGALLETLDTGVASPGLAHITGYTVSYSNLYVEQVYGGDLNGKLWRFDFGATPLSPRVSNIFTSSTSTPITAEPTIAIDGNSGRRWVFFGTGQYLDTADRATTTSQYLVALSDGSSITPDTFGTPVTLASLSLVADTLTGVPEPALGWKYLLEENCAVGGVGGSQRVANSKPPADLRIVLFSTLIPGTDPCSPGICGYLYCLEYNTGKSCLKIGGTPQENFYSSTGISEARFVRTGDDPAAPSAGGPVVQILTPDGQSITIDQEDLSLPLITDGTRHVGWRELLE